MRGKQAKPRQIQPDHLYNNLMVAKFINYLMVDGKREVAEGIVYGALDKLAKEIKLAPAEALSTALENVKPKIELRSRRVGGANYQVPVPVPEGRQNSLAMRWIINFSRDARKKGPFEDSLFQELMNAYKKEGSAFKKKEEVQRMAEANKAFSHLSW